MEIPAALSFDDVILKPCRSEVLPGETDLSTTLSRNIQLRIPLVSSAMDTVTEAPMAVALARQGGIGIVHRNLSIAQQSAEVDKVKRSESGMIVDPITMRPHDRIRAVFAVMEKYNISGVPITDDEGTLLGILTHRDLRFESNMELRVSDVMTSEDLVTVKEGISLEKAKRRLHQHRIEKLPVVDDEYRLKGLITVKDIMKAIAYPKRLPRMSWADCAWVLQ